MPANHDPFSAISDGLARSGGRIVVENGLGTGLSGPSFVDMVGRYTAAVFSLGLTPGERVLVQVPKSVSALALYLAILRAGGVFTPLDCALPPADVDAVIDDAIPLFVIARRSTLANLARNPSTSRIRASLTLEDDGTGTFADVAQAQTAARVSANVRASELAMLAYTRQQVGALPRAAKLSFGALARQVAMVQQRFAVMQTDVVSHALRDWSEPASLALAGAALASSASLLWLRPGILPNDPIPTLHIVDNPQDCATQPRSGLRLVLSTAAGPAAAHVSRYLSRPETGMLSASGPDGTVHALPGGSARVRSGAGDVLAGAGAGELEVGGENVFSGYWRKPDATQAALTADGFFKTGLQAILRDDGSVVLAPQP